MFERTRKLVFLGLLGAAAMLGQAINGEITGTVADSSKAAIPKAQLVATNLNTGGTVAVESNESGIYRLTPLPVGTYKLTATKEGFEPFVADHIEIDAAATVRVDIELGVAGTKQTVEVQATAPLLIAETASDSQVVNSTAVENLPLQVNGRFRDPVALAALTPGVTGSGYGNGKGAYQTVNNNYPIVSGGRGGLEEVMIDGSPNTGYPNAQQSDPDQPAIDTISEFKVILSNPPAEYGRTGGGVITMVTKSGTLALHGGASELIRNDFFDARPFFAATRARVRQDEFGGWLGGPVSIPKLYQQSGKTFFFFDYNGFRQSVRNTGQIESIPTDLMRVGNFSEWPKVIYNPLSNAPDGKGGTTRTPFLGNIIPPSQLDPIGLKIQALYPHPNLPGTVNNYNGTLVQNETVNAYFIKIDHNVTHNNRLMFSYRRKSDLLNNYGIMNTALDGSLPTFTPVAQNINLTDDHVISPTFLNHFTFGVVRITLAGATGDGKDAGFSVPGSFGPGRPNPCFADTYTPIGAASGANCGFNDTYRMEGHYDFDTTDNLTKFVGKHAFKWGGRIGRYGFNQRPSESTTSTPVANAPCWQCSGNYTFSSLGTSLPDAANRSASGSAWASMLLGFVDSAQAQQLAGRGWRTQYYTLFAQDDYKLASNLTLNYGLRWELEIPFYEVNGRMVSFGLAAPNPAAGGLPGATVFYGNGTGQTNNAHYLQPNYKEFSPRFGLAYQVGRNTVVRAGAAILWAPFRFLDQEQFPLKNGYDNNSFATTLNQSVTPAFYLSQGFPASSTTRGVSFGGSADPTLLNGQNAGFLQSNDGRTDETYQWTFALQHVLRWGVSVDAAYVGTMGNHLSNLTNVSINQLPVADLALGSLLNQSISSPAAVAAGYKAPYAGFQGTVAQALRPYPQVLTLTDYQSDSGHSTYHALQLKVEKRFAGGLQVTGAYSFSKTLTDSDLYANNPNYVQSEDQYNRKLNKSLSIYDTPQVLAMSIVYELPLGPGKRFVTHGGVMGRIIGGWSVGGIMTYKSGLPLIMTAPNTLPIFNGLQTPNLVSGQPIGLKTSESGFNPSVDRYVNPAAFAAPPPFTLGTLGRVLPNLRAFGQQNEDLNLIKNIKVRENVKVQLMMSFFNVLNRHDFGYPNLTLGSPAYGTITTAQNPRYGQGGVKIIF
jgi:hypothetical protein